MIVFETFWSKTVHRTKKQEETENSFACLSAASYLKSPFAYFVYFAVRYPYPRQSSFPSLSKLINSAIEKKQASSGNRKRPALIYGAMIEAALLRSDGHDVPAYLRRWF